ncbi:tyrosine-protein kinase family protein [Mucilaginibacter sp. UR6-11]|uniref:GumC family protein n=1 Tax=Mucilaginibacter sp. UR6-11 TaxID=1435644 RepID=UPI001E525891|nr:tyrosine-protein kinase family protein [Mucilaginibacter sp. UR6-11]MCC8425714.1 polysaccharide biosynthesis tyrosine autokinase [Mucilaginibacter sp. UR6-11]
MEELNKTQHKSPNQELDYLKIVRIILSRWYWIAGSVIICVLASNIYLWYTPKIYSTTAIMKFEDKKSEIGDLVGVPNVIERTNGSRLQSETVVLTSTPLLLNAIRQLDYRISFYVVGRVLNRTNELYPSKPLDIQLIKLDSTNFFHDLITFKPVSDNSFSLSYKDGGKEIQKVYRYNAPFVIGPTAISIKNPGNLSKTTSILFKLNAPEDFVARVRAGLQTSETSKNSNMLLLRQTDMNPQFATDVLNAIVKEYLNYDREQKAQSASQMIRFIDSQLEVLSGGVRGSENSIKQFKQTNKMMDLTSATERVVGKAKDLESQIDLLKIDLIAIDQLRQDIIKGKDNVNLNLVTGASVVDGQLGTFITSLNSLLVSKTAYLKTYNSASQVVQDIDKQILLLKNNALTSINLSRQLIESKIKFLQSQLGPVNQKIAELPTAERDLVSLKRDFDVNDKVYSSLSEKKIDQEIFRAGILPGATIVDLAHLNYVPVSPDERGTHQKALMLGLAIGLGVIVLIRVLNPFIYDKETVESLTTIPIIGVIRKFPDEIDQFSTQILAISKPKSIFAESVRSVRTNLNFLASEKESKVICITSEVAGEGKSFVAVNLSSTLSLIDKKVVLVAADLRRSKLHKTFHVPNDMGLSSFLANQCAADDIINHSNQTGLDFIVSGPVPPNPSELLHSERMRELITHLSTIYDIVMIDTAPIGLVSDAIPLIRISDINVFVIRSGKSKFHSATVPQRLANEYHLNNTVIVLNAFAQDLLHSRYYTTKFNGDNYGKYYYYSDYSGYDGSGYYIDPDESKWWQIWRWFKK